MIYLDDLVAASGGEVLYAGARASFPGFAHDSRQVAPGECFVAVRGPHADGHDSIEDAVAHGAGGVLAEAERLDELSGAAPAFYERLEAAGVALVRVRDTREALRRYAAHVIRAWRPLVIGVAGSTGKTTTKEAIAEVLSRVRPTFRSWRNYNDLLGLPLSLGGLEPGHAYAVVEMGCDHPGEIQALCEIACPNIGVVTNVSATQLQYFGSVSALAAELCQLPRALPSTGYAVLNGDDPAARAMGSDSEASVRFFGPVGAEAAADALDPRQPVRYSLVPLGSTPTPALTLRPWNPAAQDTPAEDVVFRHLHGDHWAYAVLAAWTVAQTLGVPGRQAADALRDLRPIPGRLNWLGGRAGLTLLDDSHNASPASVLAGLEALAGVARARGEEAARIAVLGDMLRLGAQTEDAHRIVGRRVAATATHLVTMGRHAEIIAEEAQRAGMPADHVAVTRTHQDAAEAVVGFAAGRDERADQGGVSSSAIRPPRAGALALIKGSEELRMERVTERLLADPSCAADVLDRQTQAWKRVVMMRPDRPTWLEVDLGAIGRNTRLLKELVGQDVDVLVSLKADAYGHGALAVGRTVLRNGASWLGLATLTEAAPLRESGITAPMLVFGFTAPWQAREAVRLDVRTTVYALEPARALAHAAQDLGREVRVHVKIDTGMGRLGLRTEDMDGILRFFEELRGLDGLMVEGVFTHLATADSADRSYADRQIERFERMLAALDARGLRPPIVHAANSAATLTLPHSRYNLVRPGIAVYGLAPSDEVRLPEGFRPALAFKTQVALVKDVPAGEGISYGATYVTTRQTRVATLPVGYADGFRRGPYNWGEVLVRGRRAPLLGRVCMDQCMIDVTHVPDVRIGDEVVLIGRQGDAELSAEDVARRLGTIQYEVVAELLPRVPRVS